MTLIIEKGITLRRTWQPMDPDAATYITAVETTDGQALEERTKIAIDNFVLGCKADGIWSAIKASCILAGARTLAGALVPLVGTAPTNPFVNPADESLGRLFVSGDYNRKTGLLGDGTTKYLDANRNNNVEPPTSKHLMVFQTEASTTVVNRQALGGANASGGSVLRTSTTNRVYRVNSSAQYNVPDLTFVYGAWGASRNNDTEISVRYAKSSTIVANASAVTPNSSTIFVFAQVDAPATAFFNGRIAFYSIGESLDLALLDARVTDLITAIGAAF
jgi:hypothetical protein